VFKNVMRARNAFQNPPLALKASLYVTTVGEHSLLGRDRSRYSQKRTVLIILIIGPAKRASSHPLDE
jgi:hypothetical protein